MSDMNAPAQKPTLGGNPVTQRINRFLVTPQYILLIMLLAAVSNLFSMELAVYGAFTVLVVYTCLFGEDLLPILPMVACGYATPSARNNPGKEAVSVFSKGNGGNLILIFGVIIVLSVICRLIRDRKQVLSRKYTLLPGLLVLTAGYLLSGIGSEAYPAAIWPNVRFALLQGGVLIMPYLLIAGGVKWENTRKDYFAWTGFSLGGLLLVETVWIYLTGNVVEEGIIHRENFYTGWGIHNNIGGLFAMMIPFAFYLASKYRKGWIGIVAGSVFLVGVFLSCSRGSILMAVAVYILGVLLMLYYSQNRKTNFIALGIVLCILAAVLLLFRKEILQLFSDLLSRGTDPSGRDVIYLEGWKLFKEDPIFGSSFYSPGYSPWEWSTNDGLTGIIPSRWHNTVIQLLASCGIVGMAAYSFHRIQTLWFFLKNRTKETAFIGLSLLVLVCCSLVDCHFFNMGPVLFYSMGLAFAEQIGKSSQFKAEKRIDK